MKFLGLYELHPAAELFPIVQRALDRLSADIKTHGLLTPIATYKGRVLDGKMRLIACRRLDVQPEFVELDFKDSSPIRWVIHTNLGYRRLTLNQRAVILAKIPDLFHAEDVERATYIKDINKPATRLFECDPSQITIRFLPPSTQISGH